MSAGHRDEAVLAVGARVISVDAAREIVRSYVAAGPPMFAYPAYDGFLTNGDPDWLCDADLLAPVLLNVKVSIRSYAELRSRIDELSDLLRAVPDVDLVDASDEECGQIAQVFSLLDRADRPHGALMTVMAKIFHRKRPATIPLYDDLVRSVYQPLPIPYADDRTWEEFARLFTLRVRDDLVSAREAWTDMCRLAPADGPPLTLVRALDIVAWRAGRDGLPAGAQ